MTETDKQATKLCPTTEDELAEVIATAKAPMNIAGGGTRGVGLASGAIALSTRGMSGIQLYEPGAMTLVARAGTPLDEIEAELVKNDQRLAFEPADYRGLFGRDGTPTIGGIVAANASGPRRIQVGACRDHLLGVRFVDGAGRAIKNGGRVMKNVTGYDLTKLMAGSHGTLGVLSEVSLKVLPAPEVTQTICLQGLDRRTAQKAMSRALASPFEVTGAAHTATGPKADTQTLIRLEGFESSVTYRAKALSDILAEFGEVSVLTDQDQNARQWSDIRNATPFHEKPGDVWRLSVKPSDGPGLAAKLQADALVFDWGGGLIWALMPAGTDLRARLGPFSGHATLIRADDATKARLGVFHPEPTAIAAITRGLRQKMDPRGILNPGLMDQKI